MDTVKRNHKNTLFKYIFNKAEHFLDLYEACSGLRLKASDIDQEDV